MSSSGFAAALRSLNSVRANVYGRSGSIVTAAQAAELARRLPLLTEGGEDGGSGAGDRWQYGSTGGSHRRPLPHPRPFRMGLGLAAGGGALWFHVVSGGGVRCAPAPMPPHQGGHGGAGALRPDGSGGSVAISAFGAAGATGGATMAPGASSGGGVSAPPSAAASAAAPASDVAVASPPTAASAAGGSGGVSASPSRRHAGGGPSLSSVLAATIDSMKLEEVGTQIGLGSIAGFCSGYAVKKVSKAAALTVGLAFIAVQLLRYHGMISDVNWAQLEDRLVHALDADNDGKLTVTDLRHHLNNLISVLGFNLPSGAAFGVAFLAGLRYG